MGIAQSDVGPPQWTLSVSFTERHAAPEAVRIVAVTHPVRSWSLALGPTGIWEGWQLRSQGGTATARDGRMWEAGVKVTPLARDVAALRAPRALSSLGIGRLGLCFWGVPLKHPCHFHACLTGRLCSRATTRTVPICHLLLLPR